MSGRSQDSHTVPPWLYLRKLESCPISLGSVPFKLDDALEREKSSVQGEMMTAHT